MDIICPLPAALTTIPAADCIVKFDQIIRMGLQRRQPTGTPPFVTGTKSITALASWTPYLTATDSTKLVLTPMFAGMVIPQSEEQVEGGNDNSTINGIEIYKGEGFVKVTGQMKGLTRDQYKALKALSAESLATLGVAKLTAFLFNRNGALISLENRGIDIYNFRISSVGSEGFNADNVYNFGFSFAGEWDTEVVMSDLAFSPFTDLVPVEEAPAG